MKYDFQRLYDTTLKLKLKFKFKPPSEGKPVTTVAGKQRRRVWQKIACDFLPDSPPKKNFSWRKQLSKQQIIIDNILVLNLA